MPVEDSDGIFQRLCEVTPGGVNSPFRSFGEVGGRPPIMTRAQGSRMWDYDGREYLDFCCAWGPVMLGHAHPKLLAAAQAACEGGSVLGASTIWELEFVTLIRQAFPSMEMVRLVNSGAEAVGSALRVARGVTRRPRILKFEGCYHGHVECLDGAGVEAEEAGGALAVGASPGAVTETLIARYNDLQSVESLMARHSEEVAAVILEPATGSMGVVSAETAFLMGLRELCDGYGCLLIFDEVLSGLRVAFGGAQEGMAVMPDLTCLGKALGGGHPVGAFGGRRQYMQQLAPMGPIYQAGTFCGNPVTVRAGIAQLRELSQPGVYTRLIELTRHLCEGLGGLTGDICVQQAGAMFSVGFGVRRIVDARDCKRLNRERFARFFHGMLSDGILFPPSAADAAGLNIAHNQEDIDRTLEVAARVLS